MNTHAWEHIRTQACTQTSAREYTRTRTHTHANTCAHSQRTLASLTNSHNNRAFFSLLMVDFLFQKQNKKTVTSRIRAQKTPPARVRNTVIGMHMFNLVVFISIFFSFFSFYLIILEMIFFIFACIFP